MRSPLSESDHLRWAANAQGSSSTNHLFSLTLQRPSEQLCLSSSLGVGAEEAAEAASRKATALDPKYFIIFLRTRDLQAEIISVPEGQLKLDKEGNEEEIGTGEIVAVVGFQPSGWSHCSCGAVVGQWVGGGPRETGIPQQK